MQFINWRIFSLFLSILPVTQIPMWLDSPTPSTSIQPPNLLLIDDPNLPIETQSTLCVHPVLLLLLLPTHMTLNHHPTSRPTTLWTTLIDIPRSLSSICDPQNSLFPLITFHFHLLLRPRRHYHPPANHFLYTLDCPFPFIISIGPSNSLSHIFLLSPPKLSDWLTTCCRPPKPNDTITTTDPTHSSTLSPDLYLSFNCRT